MSAMKAGVTRKTARKYLKLGDPHDPPRVAHDWLTRPDEFAGVWPEVEAMLAGVPELEALSVFELLVSCHPGRFRPGQLRTFQRRVRQWRALHGPDREIYFSQITQPGQVMQTDWTRAGELGITIGGEPYTHLLCHSVLIHSNWEWATRCASESLLAVRAGIQTALSRLGRVPRIWQIDNSSAATHQLRNDGGERCFNNDFVALAEHFGMEPRTINVSCPNENGDVESLNGHLKRRIRQHLLVRGSSDFASLELYDAFLFEVLMAANAPRCEKLAEEMAVMRELPPTVLPDYQEYEVRVGWQSTIRIKEIAYSVPSRLIGRKVRTRISETQIEVYCGREVVCTLPRRYGRARAVIDFRHVIAELVRKPGAFAGWRHRESLFPAVIFRRAGLSSTWGSNEANAIIFIRRTRSGRAPSSSVPRVLPSGRPEALSRRWVRRGASDPETVAGELQVEVEEALTQVLDAAGPFSLEATRRALSPRRFEPVHLSQPEPNLSDYDLLLEAMQEDEEVCHACC